MTFENEFDSHSEDYRAIDQDKRSNCFNDKLNKMSINEKSRKIIVEGFMNNFDATSLRPCAMWFEN